MGVAWTAGMKWFTQILSWASTILVARLVTPADYGLFGMAMVYVGFLAPIYDLGLGAAIIQRRDLGRMDIARIGGLSIAYASALSLLSLVLADPIARFYGEPAVRWIVVMLTVALLVTSLQMLPRALLSRDLAFRQLAWIDGAAALSLTAATLALAVMGFGYRAFVYGEVASAVITTVMALLWYRHRLALPWPFASIADSARFGWQVALSRIGWYVYNNADFAIIGRVIGKAALGFYTVGWTIATIPVDRVSSLVTRVLPSVLSTVQDDRQALRRYVLAITEGLALIALPVSVGLALVAEDFVVVVLGERWRPAITPLRLLAFYGGYRALATIFPPLLVAIGEAKRNLQFTLLATVVLPALFLIGTRWGVVGVAMAWIIGFPLVSIPLYSFVFRRIGLRLTSYLRALWPALSGTLAMALVVIVVRILATGSLPVPLRFGAEVATGAVTYLLLIWLLHRPRIDAFRSLLADMRRT
jgi:PST family polysaccharide transporter